MEGIGQQFKIGGTQSFPDHNVVAVSFGYLKTHASAGGFFSVSRTSISMNRMAKPANI